MTYLRLQTAKRVASNLFRKSVHYGCYSFYGWTDEQVEKWEQKTLAGFRKTKKPCSCVGCGNKRRWEGETVQEKKAPQVNDFW